MLGPGLGSGCLSQGRRRGPKGQDPPGDSLHHYTDLPRLVPGELPTAIANHKFQVSSWES